MEIILLFELKHYIADKLLQTKYHVGKTNAGLSFIFPLMHHVLVHNLYSFYILLIIGRIDLFFLIIVEFIIHFTMDRIKSHPELLGRFKNTKYKLHCILIDQSVHQINYVIYFIFIYSNQLVKLS